MANLLSLLALVACVVSQTNEHDSTFHGRSTYGMTFTSSVSGIDSNNCSTRNFDVNADAKCYGSILLALYVQSSDKLPNVEDTLLVKIPYHYSLPNKSLYTFNGVQQVTGAREFKFMSAQFRYYGILSATNARSLPETFQGYKNPDGSFRLPPNYVEYDFKNK